MRLTTSTIFTCILLTACGGKNNQTEPAPIKSVDYTKLEASTQNLKPLKIASSSALETHLKNGLRLQVQSQQYLMLRGAAQDVALAPGAVGSAPKPTTDATGAGFSQTNVHVAGVDEADIAKYDGQYWYLASSPGQNFIDVQATTPGINIVATDPKTPNAEFVGRYNLEGDLWGDVGQMYLVQKDQKTQSLAVIRNRWGNVSPLLPGLPVPMAMATATTAVSSDIAVKPNIAIGRPAIWIEPQNSQVEVDLINVENPQKPNQDWRIQIDGSLIQSRKVGNTLYLITRFDPWLKALTYDQGDVALRTANETLIAKTPTSELMPTYQIGQQKWPLNDACYLQEGLKETQGLRSLVNITAIDLVSRKLVSSLCVNSSVENMSMSQGSLYLLGTVYDNANQTRASVIHKFSLDANGATYQATGSVSGGLIGNGDPAFRMHEYQDQFRIVTTDWLKGAISHKLTILQQAKNDLVMLSELPNAKSPDPIGKPGEDIHSVRFEDNRAYVVTFRRTDPLYTLDLTDPANPTILGALEIPGFATYMHPVGNGYLFTFGQSADSTGRVDGIKAELFDVQGKSPKLIDTLLLGGQGSYSEALYNLHTLSFLQVNKDQIRIAMPVTVANNYQWAYNGLQLLEINGLSNQTPRLTTKGVVTTASIKNSALGLQNSQSLRGILHDNAVFVTQSNAVWAAFWNTPEKVKGPILDRPVAMP